MIKSNQTVIDHGKKYDGILVYVNGELLILPAPIYPPFITEYNIFKGLNVTFKEKIAIGGTDISGFKTQKTTDKRNGCITFGALAETGYAFATVIGDEVLQGKMNWTKPKLFNLPDETSLGTMKSINDALSPFIGDVRFTPYLITAAVLGAAMNQRHTSELSMGALTSEHVLINQAKKYALKTSIPAQELSLKAMTKLLSHMGAEFKGHFIELNHIVDTGIHHDHLLGKILKSTDHSNISGAQIKILEHPEHFTHSNLLGDYELQEFPSGTWRFEVSCVGYITIVVILTIEKSEIVHHDFMLIPV